MNEINKPRFVFINLQETNFLVTTYYSIKNGWKVKTFKHRFLLDYLIQNGYEIINYIVPGEAPIEDVKKECEIVYDANGLTNLVTNIFDDKQIKKTDILIVYFHYYDQYLAGQKVDCFKVCMGNHFIRVDGQHDLAKDGYDVFVNEVDLSENEFVNYYFNVSGVENVLCPYIFADRFIEKVPFSSRKNKAMAVGTLSTCEGLPDYDCYRKYFKTDWIQPMRYEIWKNKRNLKDIDCYISYIYEGVWRIKDTDNFFIKILKKIYNKLHRRQGKYTSFDMVDKFNEYKMFICPEELVGMPGIGFVEGMACGTAYIGLKDKMYECLGLIPDYHYITYDGTLSDLEKKVSYYESHPKELETIAANGTKFVRDHFNTKKVSDDFFKTILKLEESR